MINFVTGRPGGGKSLYGVMQICRELEISERIIVTNLSLDLVALAAWAHEKISKPVDVAGRVKFLEDQYVSEFWLWAPAGRLPGRRNMPGMDRDVPDFSPRSEGWPGCLYVIDEVHLFFNAREWQKVSFDAEFFMSQHRKLRCDVILISQHPEKVDKNFRRNAQDFTTIRNLGNEKFLLGVSFARLFRYSTYLDMPRPGSNEHPMETGMFKLNVKEYGSLYDTSAGVGLTGRIATNEKPKGRSPLLLVVACVVLIIVAFLTPKAVGSLMNYGVSSLMHYSGHASDGLVKKSGGASAAMAGPVAPVVAGAAVASPEPTNQQTSVTRTNAPLEVVGIVRVPMNEKVLLSDGRILSCRSHDVLGIESDCVYLRKEGRVPIRFKY